MEEKSAGIKSSSSSPVVVKSRLFCFALSRRNLHWREWTMHFFSLFLLKGCKCFSLVSVCICFTILVLLVFYYFRLLLHSLLSLSEVI